MEEFKKLLAREQRSIAILFAILLLLIILAAGYGYWQLTSLSTKLLAIEARFDTTSRLLEDKIVESHNILAGELVEGKQNVTTIKREIGDITGTVTTLEKISKTDPELLQKYSKVFFLNEHYEPTRLTEIANQYGYFEDREIQIHSSVWPHLENLIREAERDNEELFIFSAYRSFGTQEALKGQYSVTFGVGANQFSADQGYSEHQLGTTVDFITTGIGGTLEGFENTDAYRWLRQNAHLFGFTLSYPENNSFYVFEPWHWRFVGVELATELFKSKRNFYNLDQREIDEYLVSLFD